MLAYLLVLFLRLLSTATMTMTGSSSTSGALIREENLEGTLRIRRNPLRGYPLRVLQVMSVVVLRTPPSSNDPVENSEKSRWM